MSSKSRLGKGLGALFPTLPGESAPQSQSATVVPVAKTPSASTPSVKKDVSRETSESAVKDKPNAKDKKSTPKTKRVSVPTLSEISRPSDLFFGTAVKTANARNSVVDKHDSSVTATSADATQETATVKQHDVSRETSVQAEPKPELKPVEGGYLAELKLADIGPNAQQPRTIFDEDDLNELAASIKEVGVLQPIVVRKRSSEAIAAAKQHVSRETSNPFEGRLDSTYELIMGERRWRASQLAGLETIPAIVKTTADDDMLRDALLENLHRVALNPLEEAAAYQQMIKEFGLTQAELSKSISKSRPQIANTLRLLNLPASVQKKVAAGVLSAGHARALLALDDAEAMDKLATRIIAEGLSVRSTEEIVAMSNDRDAQKPAKAKRPNPWDNSPIQQRLEHRFDTKVAIKGTNKHGRIEITFSSPEDMDRILALLAPDASKSSDGWI